MGAAPHPGDPSIESLLAEFQSAPSISLGEGFPALDDPFLRPPGAPPGRPAAAPALFPMQRPETSSAKRCACACAGDSAQSLPAFPPFGKRALQPQDSAYILTQLLPNTAFGSSGGKSSSGTHNSGELSDGTPLVRMETCSLSFFFTLGWPCVDVSWQRLLCGALGLGAVPQLCRLWWRGWIAQLGMRPSLGLAQRAYALGHFTQWSRNCL